VRRFDRIERGREVRQYVIDLARRRRALETLESRAIIGQRRADLRLWPLLTQQLVSAVGQVVILPRAE
jgi:hypothetical protein